MTDTRLACSVCARVFSEHRAAVDSSDPEEGLRCPDCGSAQLEPYEFDPDAPVEDPIGGPGEEDAAS